MKSNYSSKNNLKKLRENRKLTLNDLAQKSGVSLQEIHFIENDRLDLTKVKWETLTKLCNALKVTPYQLFVDKEFANTLLTFTKKYYKGKYIAKQ